MGIDKEYITMKHKWNKDLTNYKYKQGTCANCGGTTNYKEDYKGTFARQKKYCFDCEWDVHLSFDEWITSSIKGNFIPLEIMDTPELQVQGMMGRNKLKGGMVFPYDEVEKREFLKKMRENLEDTSKNTMEK